MSNAHIITLQARLQAALPVGLELGDPISEAGLPTGESFHPGAFHAVDRRGDIEARGRDCVICWLPLAPQDGQQWLPELLRRSKVLTESGLPELVSLSPLEIGRLDLSEFGPGLYVVERPFASTLADQVLPRKPLPEKLIDSLSRELIRSLAELHRLGITHGAIGPQQIRLSSAALNETTHAWLGGVVTGHLQQATGNQLLHQSIVNYQRGLPDGVPIPSQSADVHQLLLTMTEARLGTAAFLSAPSLTRLQQIVFSPTWLRSGLAAASQKSRHWEDGKRLQLAVFRRRRWLEVATVVLLIAMLTLGFLWQRAHSSETRLLVANAKLAEDGNEQRERIGELQIALSSSQSSSERLEGSLRELTTEKQKLEARNRELETKVKALGGSSSSPVLTTQVFWKRHLTAGPVSQEKLVALDDYKSLPLNHQADVKLWNQQWHDLLEVQQKFKLNLSSQIERFRTTPWANDSFGRVARRVWQEFVGSEGSIENVPHRMAELDRNNTARRQLGEWHKQVIASRKTEIQRRWPENHEIEGAIKKYSLEPWNNDAYQRLIKLDRELNRAYEIWSVAVRGAKSWEQLRQQVKDEAEKLENADIKDRLTNQWLGVERTPSWNIQWTDGAASPGHGHYRVLQYGPPNHRLYGGGHYVEETWGSDTRRLLASSSIKMNWIPGQSIQWVLYTERSVYRVGARPCLLDKTVGGPFALWTLFYPDDEKKSGVVEDSSGLAWIVLRCKDFEQLFPKPR